MRGSQQRLLSGASDGCTAHLERLPLPAGSPEAVPLDPKSAGRTGTPLRATRHPVGCFAHARGHRGCDRQGDRVRVQRLDARATNRQRPRAADLRFGVHRLSTARFSTAIAGGAPRDAARSDAVGSRFTRRRPTAAPHRSASGGAGWDLAGAQAAAMDGALIHPGPPGGRPKFRRSPAAAARGYSDLLPSRMDRHRAAPG